MTDMQERRPRGVESYSAHHLVGPEFYPLYVLVLKIVLTVVIGAAILEGAVEANATGATAINAFAKTMAMAWNGAFVAIGAVTALFALLVRWPVAGRKVLQVWDRSLPEWTPIRRVRPTRVHHVAALAAQGLFVLYWTIAIRPSTSIPLGYGVTLDLARDLYWSVLALAAGVIAVNGLKLMRATGDRVTRALNLALQLALLTVACVALGAAHWVSASPTGASARAIAELAYGVNVGAEAGLIAIICVAAVGAAVSLLALFSDVEDLSA